MVINTRNKHFSMYMCTTGVPLRPEEVDVFCKPRLCFVERRRCGGPIQRDLSLRSTSHSTGLVQSGLSGAWKGVEKGVKTKKEKGQKDRERQKGREGGGQREQREAKEAYLPVAR